MATTYTEPKKETFKWTIEKYPDKGSPSVFEFNSKQAAWDFLRTINVYVDGKLSHTEIT